MNKIFLTWACVGIVLVMGCSRWFGIHRTATLDSAPDLDCIEAVLKKDGDVRAVGIHDFGGGRKLTWRGLGPPVASPTFTYQYDGREYLLWVHIEEGESIEFHHAASAARAAPASELQAIRRHLTRIESSLEATCHMQEFRHRLKERCYGEHCDEIEPKAA